MSLLVMTLCGFAGGLAGELGFAVGGLAGACGQFAVQGAGGALLSGEEPAGPGDCAAADSPAIEKTRMKARMWRRTERVLLIHSHFNSIACSQMRGEGVT